MKSKGFLISIAILVSILLIGLKANADPIYVRSPSTSLAPGAVMTIESADPHADFHDCTAIIFHLANGQNTSDREFIYFNDVDVDDLTWPYSFEVPANLLISAVEIQVIEKSLGFPCGSTSTLAGSYLFDTNYFTPSMGSIIDPQYQYSFSTFPVNQTSTTSTSLIISDDPTRNLFYGYMLFFITFTFFVVLWDKFRKKGGD